MPMPLSGRQAKKRICRVMMAALLAGSAMGAEAQPANQALPAFPGAEGFGAWAVGGRGGDVYLVTTLADYGPDEPPIEGSLRAAVEAEGPRTVVFGVAGTLALERPLEIHHPYLTLAAQTAPGDGVALKNYGVDIHADEVVLRHLRVRPGDVGGVEQDAINVRSRNVIVDHCSVSWGTDETLSVIGAATDVTVQHCLIAESLNESVHSKGAHGYGTLITASGDVTIHHTVYAFHESRSPRPKDVLLDFRHNLVVGYGDQPGYNYADFTRMNYVGNVIEPRAYSKAPRCGFNVGGANARIFAAGNRLLADGRLIADEREFLCPTRGLTQDELDERVRVAMPIAAPSVTGTPPEELRETLLGEAGATLPARDAVDRRVLGLVEAKEGGIIDSQEDVGGWPELSVAEAPEDRDRDGMPDAWERRHGLDPEDGDDHREDLDGDGYTNLEEYLNGTDPAEPFRWIPPPTLVADGPAFADSVLVVTVEAGDPSVPVHVTLDGSEPTAASPRYREPLRLTESTHVRAKVVQPGVHTTAAFAFFEKLDWLDALADLPADLRSGLRATHYEADDWDEGPPPEALTPTATDVADDIDAVLQRNEPGTAVLLDGYLDVPRDGVYTFYLHDDTRSRLLIDGRVVTPGMPSGQRPGRIALRSGKHRFHLRSLHEAPRRDGSLTWEGSGIDRQPIPAARLSYGPADSSTH